MKIKISSSLIYNAIGLLATIYPGPIAATASIITATSASTDCCDFDTDDCGASGPTWNWSKDTPPTIPIPPNSGDFMWAYDPGQLQLPPSVEVRQDAEISMSFFLNSAESVIVVIFYPTRGPAATLATLSYTDSIWFDASFLCAGCCPSGTTCNGTFAFVTTGYGSDFEVAIDSWDIDHQCDGLTNYLH